MGVKIQGTLPEKLLIKSMDAIYKDAEFIEWWKKEANRENAKYATSSKTKGNNQEPSSL